ncbi:Nuclear apoptosis-inducing factor 1 [Collichthys lucidus]|uniref:Nuclear apoptosis-inducing factor 1 n=1 Tax=Collichthys lucidus TaxID=240159 RepID=A0A4U5V2N7_COLLU|nr:Nuclear apoptosis-inducing factor 1 [Collichthys lucidus]
MSVSWRDDDEEFRVGGVRGGLKSKPRFSFTEVKLLLEAVKRNRYIILRKFNHGVSAEMKKQTWAEITDQINGLGENHREVRQIMKKWADLKCDGKRRIVALRGPNGSNLRKKNLGPVERMVHKILMMSPRGDRDSDLELGDDDDFPKLYNKGPPSSNAPAYSYLSLTDSSYSLPGGASFDISPLSSPEKELGGDPFHSSSEFDLDMADDGEQTMDFDENDDSSLFSSYPPSAPPPSSTTNNTSLDPLPDDALLRVKPVHTYSRNSSQNHTTTTTSSRPPTGPSTSSDFPSASDADAASSSVAPPPPQSPTGSSSSAPATFSSKSANDSTSEPAPSTSSSSIPPPPPAPTVAVSSSSVTPTTTSAPSSNSNQPSTSSLAPPPTRPSTSTSSGSNNASDPLPAGASARRAHDHVAQMASQSLQQQRASRMLLTSVSQSLEVLAQSVQLLVESQQEFVQESLLLQRETVDILRDFSNTALTMLRDKANSGQVAAHHPQPATRF